MKERNLIRAMDSKEEEEEQMEVYKSEDGGEKDSDYDQAAENDYEQGAQDREAGGNSEDA